MKPTLSSRLQTALFGLTAALSTAAVLAAPPNATLYKSPYCGCCEEYVKYLKQNGFNVKTINKDDMNTVKTQYGTRNVASCHTMQIGQYVVEGHVPVAAIRKMLKEKPAIKGIALPGMPPNSPGMGPEKPGSLNITAIQKDGSARHYMKL
ncbi:DUF411 domain-containing protein [Neisseria animalis]|uniref:CopG family transcriptional regulator n=1 Tax=Neisseria animalis TaxID=492 RepID=A0A5P3MNV2_NEIAN|nr:DUF411 domain-containing protein [Neisseria animalis]QEY23234.1 CopG family transcriptional regulator [Neisseria animalis]ROW31808.1 CopG family transcriptional regulator [Neisseria animalis]VEE08455.1 Protein of uncharacterised function, DUF [Neisseria animalis]